MIAAGAVGCKPVLGSTIEDGGSNSKHGAAKFNRIWPSIAASVAHRK